MLSGCFCCVVSAPAVLFDYCCESVCVRHMFTYTYAASLQQSMQHHASSLPIVLSILADADLIVCMCECGPQTTAGALDRPGL